MTLTLCAGVFLLGLLSDYLVGRWEAEGPLFQILHIAIPNFQFFWLGDALTQGLSIPGRQVALAASYAVVYAMAVLSFGVACSRPAK